MTNRSLLVVAVTVLYLSICSGPVLGEGTDQPMSDAGGKTGILQRIKNSYDGFRNRLQQKTKAQEVKKEEPKEIGQSKAQQIEQPEDRAVQKELTKDEILAVLKEALADNDEVFDMVPGLKSEEDEHGNIFYLFKGAKLEDLSKEELEGLLTKARQAIVRLRTDRIQRQLEMTRQVNNIKRVTAPPQPPRVPSAPPSPPATPKPPSAPPSPPSSRR